jgi:AcrR family transcriptional regulator
VTPVSSAGGGRPLDPSRDRAIVEAALAGLADLGYDRLSMDEIASRARVGKAALYRRWPSKAALVAAAVAARREELAPVAVPDTGSFAGDLAAIVDGVPDFDERARHQIGVFVGLVAAAGRDPELRRALTESVLERPRRVLREVLDRAVARGEVSADRDLSLLADAVIGLNLVRTMLDAPPDRAYVKRVLDTIVYPLATGVEGETKIVRSQRQSSPRAR